MTSDDSAAELPGYKSAGATPPRPDEDAIALLNSARQQLVDQLGRVIVGQEAVIERYPSLPDIGDG